MYIKSKAKSKVAGYIILLIATPAVAVLLTLVGTLSRITTKNIKIITYAAHTKAISRLRQIYKLWKK